jgi:hypothetical protein
MGLLMPPTPTQVGFDRKSGWWIIEPLEDVAGDLHECNLVSISLATAGEENVVTIILGIPGQERRLQLDFVVTSAKLVAEDITQVPDNARGQISATDYAAPNWYSLEALRGDIEMYSIRQSFEWID